MIVQLYVYDLSRGLARSMSRSLLGTFIEAVYHTGIVFEGVEYTYDGGIKAIRPAQLGAPMEILELGTTHLPMEVIMEYLESLKEIYTADAYDLWTHNCNNFSNDMATFLLGKGIPEHITNLPQTVLDSPFGRIMKPQIDEMVRNRNRQGGLIGVQNTTPTPKSHQQLSSSVRKATTLRELDALLEESRNSCAVVFFTSPNCKPCKNLYIVYDELAAEYAHNAALIMVDISRSFDIGSRYGVRATPTFVTFLHGQEERRWSGAEPETLRGNIKVLVQMAWPPHSHESLELPVFRGASTIPVTYSKIPPLGKLRSKMGAIADDAALAGALSFISTRAADGAAEATLPDLTALSRFLKSAPSKLPAEVMFTVVDTFRCALIDPRFSGYYAEEKDHATVASLLTYVNTLENCPYSLRLVALQMACNLFTSPLYPEHILGCSTLAMPITQLISTSLLDVKNHHVRVAAASLTFNMASANSRYRGDQHRDVLSEECQVELAASLIEAISAEKESPEALKGYLLALGFLIYRCPTKDGEMMDLLKALAVQDTIATKRKLFSDEKLIHEIGEELIGKGVN